MKKALILIEYQNEWLLAKSKLNKLIEDREQFQKSVTNSKEVLLSSRESTIEVIFVIMNPSPINYKVLGNGEYGLRAIIPKAATWQGEMANIPKDFSPLPHEFIIKERSGSSAFAGSVLDSYLRNNGITEIYLAGYALHVCVESTLRQGHDLGYKTHVIHDACSAFTLEQKEYFLNHTIHHFGRALSTKEYKRILHD